MDKMAIH